MELFISFDDGRAAEQVKLPAIAPKILNLLNLRKLIQIIAHIIIDTEVTMTEIRIIFKF